MEVSLWDGKAGEAAESNHPMSDGYGGISGESIRAGSTATGEYASTVPAGKVLPVEVEVAPGYTADFDHYDPGHFEGHTSARRGTVRLVDLAEFASRMWRDPDSGN